MKIRYTEYLELVRKFFIKDSMFDGKVLVARTPNKITEGQLDFTFYLANGIDFTDYCLLDPILAKRNYFNKSQINNAVNTEENRTNGTCGYVIFEPNRRFNDNSGQVQSFSPTTYEKIIGTNFQHDIVCGKPLDYVIANKKKNDIINTWVLSYKLCYSVATQDDIDLVHKYNENFKIEVGDKIPPIHSDNLFINVDIIDLSVLIEKLEKAKDDFIKVYPKTYSDEKQLQ